jgi:hypothetical protein
LMQRSTQDTSAVAAPACLAPQAASEMVPDIVAANAPPASNEPVAKIIQTLFMVLLPSEIDTTVRRWVQHSISRLMLPMVLYSCILLSGEAN